MILVISAVCVGAAVLLAWLGWSAQISLSVAAGGGIGLANLLLWQYVVQGLVAHRVGGAMSGGGLAIRMVFKLIPLAAFVLVVFRTSLDPIGVMAGFGSTLFGLCWAGLHCKGGNCKPVAGDQ